MSKVDAWNLMLVQRLCLSSSVRDSGAARKAFLRFDVASRV